MEEKQLGWYFDADNCIGCRACEAACKQRWNVDVGVRWRKVHIYEGGKYPNPIVNYNSMACNHCEKPQCLEICPVQRYTKREKDGLVVYNDVKVREDGSFDYSQNTCIFCGMCHDACPYNLPQPNENPTDGSPQHYEKCIGCWPRVEAGEQPACARTCMGLALFFGELSEQEKRPVAERQIVGFPDDNGICNPSTRLKPARRTSKDLAEVETR